MVNYKFYSESERAHVKNLRYGWRLSGGVHLRNLKIDNDGGFCCERLENFLIASLPYLRSIMTKENPPLDAIIIHPTPIVFGSKESKETAGLAIVTATKAVLWNDTGLFVHRSIEFSQSWTVMDSTSSLENWVSKNLPDYSIIGFDPYCFSAGTLDVWDNSFASEKQISLFPLVLDHLLFNSESIIPNNNSINIITTNIAMTRQLLQQGLSNGLIVGSPVEVNSLYSFQAKPYSPLPNIVALITLETARIYLHDVESLSTTVVNHFSDSDVEVRDFKHLLTDAQLLLGEGGDIEDYWTSSSIPFALHMILYPSHPLGSFSHLL